MKLVINWVRTLEGMLHEGWYWNNSGILVKLASGFLPKMAWIFSSSRIKGATHSCKLLTQLFTHALAQTTRSVPSFCEKCFKVVVYPRNIDEARTLLEIFENSLPFGRSWKVGPDTRNYTKAQWGGYIYCRGMVDALGIYDNIVPLVEEAMPGIDAFVKQGCTEYEMALGPTDEYVRHELADQIEEEFFERVDEGELLTGQPPHMRVAAMAEWVDWSGKVDWTPVKYHLEPKPEPEPEGEGKDV